jgi:hypothetical protein
VASTVGNGDALGGVGWLVGLCGVGVKLGGQQDNIHRLGVSREVVSKQKREREGFLQGNLGLPFFPQ